MAQNALDYTRQYGAIISGEPQVVLSRDASVAEVAALGFGQWIFQEGCVVPMHIVIVKGISTRVAYCRTQPCHRTRRFR